MPGERLAEVLSVLSGSGVDLSREELLDALWLARLLPAADPNGPDGGAPVPSPGPGSAREPAPPPPAAPDGPPPPPPPPAPPAGGPGGAGGLHAAPGRCGDAPGAGALPLRVPGGRALRDELGVGRALRPLRRPRPSPSRREVDEEATATAVAETGLPDVVLRPARDRWLDLALVVDDGMSMLLWQRLAAELHALLRRAGAFRDVRTYGLDTRRDGGPAVYGRPFAPSPGAGTAPGLLADPAGRRLVLVVSDGMGPAWRDGRMHSVLADWARCGPAAVVHALPPRMWGGSGIRADRWQVTARRRGAAGGEWEIADPVLPPELAPFGGLPVPVLAAAPAPLATWARLLAAPGGTAVLPLLAAPVGDRPAAAPAARDGTAGLLRFKDAASPEAYRLAAHLAAVAPVSVPVMRLVQEAVPWRADTAQLAEVFLGGLLRPVAEAEGPPLLPQHLLFDFPRAARDALLDALPAAELLATDERVGERLADLAGRSPEFPAWLARRDGPDRLAAGGRPFARVGGRLAERLGAPSGHGEAEPAPEGWRELGPDDPRHLGPWTLLARSDAGTRGPVYLSDGPDGEQVVIRTVEPDAPATATDHLRMEAEALRRMNGRYAPGLVADGLDDEPPWLAMESRRRVPVWGYLADVRAGVDERQAAELARQLCDAVAVCHREGMVHGYLHFSTVQVASDRILLTGWSGAIVDGAAAWGVNPTISEADNVRSLARIIRALRDARGPSDDGPQRWAGPEWRAVHDILRACLAEDPAARPTAAEVAEVFERRTPDDGPGGG